MDGEPSGNIASHGWECSFGVRASQPQRGLLGQRHV